jgi:hypothetical protein
MVTRGSAQGGGGFFAFDDTSGRLLDLVDDAHDFQELDDVIGRVKFPPKETLPSAVRVVMVVIVPALAESDDGENEGVPAGFPRLITAGAKEVAEGIDGEGGVIKDHRAKAEAPEEIHHAAHGCSSHQETEKKGDDGQEERWDDVVPVNENELRKLGEILHALSIILVIIRSQHPADVGPVKTLLFDGMDVILLVGMLVVVPMMSCPPERTFLSGHTAQPGQDELEPAGSFKGTMREISVITASDAEFTDQEQSDAKKNCGEIGLHEKGRDGEGVESEKEDATEIELEGRFSHNKKKRKSLMTVIRKKSTFGFDHAIIGTVL